MDSIVLLAGGVGASKLAVGLDRVVRPGNLTIVSNVGDDEEIFGLHVSPDIDIVTYALVGLVDETKGWGVAGDTFSCDAFLRQLGESPWLLLGDKDLAVNIARTNLLKQGARLSEVTKRIAEALGVRQRIIPVTDNRLTTMLFTEEGQMTFERYFVKEVQRPAIDGVTYSGSGFAEPAPGVLEAIESADVIVFAPSNPVASIQPILSVKKVRASIVRSKAFKVAVSPIIAGRTVKGPADKMMRALGYDVSPLGVARFYDGMIDCILLDRADQAHKEAISSLGVRALVDDILMPDIPARIRVGEAVLKAKDST